MKSSKIIPVIGFTALALLLAFVFSSVMDKRFSSGTIYPHYSTQRTDPLGSQAVFDSFDRLDSISASRNFEVLTRIKTLDEDTALVLLGLPRQSVDDMRAKADSPVIKAVKEKGVRLVITIDPEIVNADYTPQKSREEKDWFEKRREIIQKRNKEQVEREAAKKKENQGKDGKKSEDKKKKGAEKDGDSKLKVEKEPDDEKKDKKENKKEKDPIKDSIDEFFEYDEEELEKEAEEKFGSSLFDQWDIDFAYVSDYKHPDGGWEPRVPANAAKMGTPILVPNWHSQFRFEIDDSAKADWKVIATVDKKPVVVERKLGKGTVVLTTDSFFASNESLHNGTLAEFLLWLVGDKSKIVFDETLHGTTVRTGSMKLVKRYRLHGLFIGLFVLVFMWAWRSATSLAPGSEAIDGGIIGSGGTVSGEETSSGLVQLLRRSIPSKDLLMRCAEIWKGGKNQTIKPQEEAELSAILNQNRTDSKSLDTVSAYRRITDLLKKKV